MSSTTHFTHRIPNSKNQLVLEEDHGMKNGKPFYVAYLEHDLQPENWDDPKSPMQSVFNVCNSEYFELYGDALACFRKRRDSENPFNTISDPYR